MIRDAAHVAHTPVIECPLPTGGIEGIKICPRRVSVKVRYNFDVIKIGIKIVQTTKINSKVLLKLVLKCQMLNWSTIIIEEAI